MDEMERYQVGWSDPRGTFQTRFGIPDRIEYKMGMTNWMPPKYGVFKYINGCLSGAVVEDVSQDAAHGYMKLLKEE